MSHALLLACTQRAAAARALQALEEAGSAGLREREDAALAAIQMD